MNFYTCVILIVLLFLSLCCNWAVFVSVHCRLYGTHHWAQRQKASWLETFTHRHGSFTAKDRTVIKSTQSISGTTKVRQSQAQSVHPAAVQKYPLPSHQATEQLLPLRLWDSWTHPQHSTRMKKKKKFYMCGVKTTCISVSNDNWIKIKLNLEHIHCIIVMCPL